MKISNEELEFITLLEQTCNQTATACTIMPETIAYLVEKGKIGMVVGKKGENIKKLREKTGKNIEVFEFYPNSIDFIKNVFPGINLKEAVLEKNTLLLSFNSIEDKIKGLKNKNRFNAIKEILKKGFGIEKIRVK
ncbi:MAG: NusA-like transcription termination signal-binding factor [Candidatus Diapherotrites archaeon]